LPHYKINKAVLNYVRFSTDMVYPAVVNGVYPMMCGSVNMFKNKTKLSGEGGLQLS